MSALDTAMLTAMRAAIAELLPDTCSVITLTRTADGMGGHVDTRATATAINCRLDVVTGREQIGREQIAGGGLQPFTSYMLSLPYDATVVTQNEILHNGNNYAVKSVNQSQSWKAVVRVELEKL